jgi:hypothetical protein
MAAQRKRQKLSDSLQREWWLVAKYQKLAVTTKVRFLRVSHSASNLFKHFRETARTESRG